MTLVEVMFAMSILALLLGGLLATMIQSRRLTEGSLDRMVATTIAQGYMEQIKSMQLNVMANQNATGVAQISASFSLPTQSDQVTADPILTTPSGAAWPTLTSSTPGVTPAGPIDNLKNFSPNATGIGHSASAASTWSVIWPGSTSAGQTSATNQTPAINDLHLNIWVQIKDLTPNGQASTPVYGIAMLFTWQVRNGALIKYGMDELHAIRSSIPSF